jgi:hypothetical protein
MVVIKDIFYSKLEDLWKKKLDMKIAYRLLINMDEDEAIDLLEANHMIKDGNIIIPAGLELTEKIKKGKKIEYSFFGDAIIATLRLKNESEYIV